LINALDWLWRIAFGAFLHYLVKNTDITLIEPITHQFSIINALFGGFLLFIGVVPLLSKTFFQKKLDLKSKDEDKLSTSQNSKMLIPKSLDGEKTELSSSIYSPTKLNYSNRCVIKWFFKEGDFIPQNSLLLQIKETKSKKGGGNAFSIVADRDCILSKRVFKQHIIYDSGALLCELTYTEDDTTQLAKSNSMLSGKKSSAEKYSAALKKTESYMKPAPRWLNDTNKKLESEPQKIKSDKKDDVIKQKRHKKAQNQTKKKTRKHIQSDLSKLKQLKEDGLITQETWEEKQKEILKDY